MKIRGADEYRFVFLPDCRSDNEVWLSSVRETRFLDLSLFEKPDLISFKTVFLFQPFLKAKNPPTLMIATITKRMILNLVFILLILINYPHLTSILNLLY